MLLYLTDWFNWNMQIIYVDFWLDAQTLIIILLFNTINYWHSADKAVWTKKERQNFYFNKNMPHVTKH